MITGTPDPSLGLARLEREMRGFHAEAAAAAEWGLREKYVDRGHRDPFYILDFRKAPQEPGDDLMDEALFITRYAGIKVKHITRQREGKGHPYWWDIGRDGLAARLTHFMTMFREDYLRPPGTKGDLHNPDRQHERFYGKRFLYRISSPNKTIIGVGPRSFAGSPFAGAMRGEVSDGEGNPLAHTIIELVSETHTVERKTDADGLFWITAAPPGLHRLRVPGKVASLRIVDEECFGNVKGMAIGEDGGALVNRPVELLAPDQTVIAATTDGSGRFTTGPLPAFPYILSLPGFLFSATARVTADAAIHGELHTAKGAVLPRTQLLLKLDGQEIREAQSDGNGRFAFEGLKCGRYVLSVPGYDIYLRAASDATVRGQLTGAVGPVEIELVAQERVVATATVEAPGGYIFDRLPPGSYALRVMERLIARTGSTP